MDTRTQTSLTIYKHNTHLLSIIPTHLNSMEFSLSLLYICFRPRTRRANIHDFCVGYINSNNFIIATYIPKRKRQSLKDSIAKFDDGIKMLMTTDISGLEYVTTTLFNQRPSEIPYVVTLLEYFKENFDCRDIKYFVDILYKHSEFNPCRRYNYLTCVILYFFNLL